LKNEKRGLIILLLTGILSLGGIFYLDPIVQDESYHLFSDEYSYFGIPNFWNVLSNFPFLIVALLGLKNPVFPLDQKKMYGLFFIGIGLVSLGSGYYHLYPNSHTLVWDRLPMTITFMALFSIIISEFISRHWGKLLFLPLIIVGILSVAYWKLSATGDLRFYGLIQFYPMIAIPVILTYFKSSYNRSSAYWYLLLAYLLAKLCEHFDSEIHETLIHISGHSLKHICAALGLYVLVDSYKKRVVISD